jgi:hypothetical protein
MSGPNQPEKPKEPFVGSGDRPESKLNPDTPLSELRVRDLATLLGSQGQAVIKKPELLKEFKFEKYEKFEKWEHKYEKWEIKYEKWEHKHEPWEYVTKQTPEGIPDPTQGVGPDPLGEIIKAVTGLQAQVNAMNERLNDMQKQ